MPVIPYVKNPTWADGSGGGTSIDAADLNKIEAGVFEAHQMPAVRVFHNATQSLTTGTDTALAFNSERFDTAGGAASTQHDTVTNNSRLTCLFAGKYAVFGHVEFAGSSNVGHREAFVRINATASQKIGLVGTQAVVSGLAARVTVSTLVDLAVNDFVELFAFQDSGGALNVSASSATVQYGAEFMMYRVG